MLGPFDHRLDDARDRHNRLVDVTFVVVDLETTGGSPATCAITEIGAVKVRGGERLGTFRTFVDPGTPVPAGITALTGISTEMVQAAPPAAAVMPLFLEFLGTAVLVGHNVRFDMGFLQAALEAAGYRRLRNHVVDTCILARRLVGDEVDNCKLATLARRFRTEAAPRHRALDDAEATTELLHALLERAATLGVFELDDLLDLPRTARHREVAKLKLVSSLPHEPGVYVFRDRRGDALYAGRARDMRQRVRSFFRSDDKRRVAPLLHELHAIDHFACPHDLATDVLLLRAIHALRPRYNRSVMPPAKRPYVRLTPGRAPVISRRMVVDDGASYLGPLPSYRAARAVRAALLRPDHPTTSADLVAALERARRAEATRAAGRFMLTIPDSGGAIVDDGALVAAWPEGAEPQPLPIPPVDDPHARADEIDLIALFSLSSK